MNAMDGAAQSEVANPVQGDIAEAVLESGGRLVATAALSWWELGDKVSSVLKTMKAEYDFSKVRRGQAVPTKGKTRITIYIDDQIVAAFKAESARTGIGYQTLINEALGQHLGTAEKPITAEQVRKIVRDELAQVR
jgi:uncharacterized protein (DUF4415 family)